MLINFINIKKREKILLYSNRIISEALRSLIEQKILIKQDDGSLRLNPEAESLFAQFIANLSP